MRGWLALDEERAGDGEHAVTQARAGPSGLVEQEAPLDRPPLKKAVSARAACGLKAFTRQERASNRTVQAWCILGISMSALLLFLKYVPNFIPGLQRFTCPNFHQLEPHELEEACSIWSPDAESYDQAIELLLIGFIAWLVIFYGLFHSARTREVLWDGSYAQIVTHAGWPLLNMLSVFTINLALEKVVNEKRHADLLLPVYLLRSACLLRLAFMLLDGVEVELEEEVLKERLMAEHPVFLKSRSAMHDALMTGDASADALFQSDVLIADVGCDKDVAAMLLIRHVWYPFSALTKCTIAAVVLARWSGLDMTASALAASYFALSVATSVVTGMAYIPRLAGALAIYYSNLFTVGERVSLRSGSADVVSGWVKRVDMMSVTIIDDSNFAVIVPNQLLMGYSVVNISRTPRFIVQLSFSCSSRCAPDQIDALLAHLREYIARHPAAERSAPFQSVRHNRCVLTGFNASGFGCELRMTLRPGEGPLPARGDVTLAIARAARRLCIPIEFNTISVHGMDGIPLMPPLQPQTPQTQAQAGGVGSDGRRAAPSGAEVLAASSGASGSAPVWTPAQLALGASALDGGRITHYVEASAQSLPPTEDLLPPQPAPQPEQQPPSAYTLRVEFASVHASERSSLRRHTVLHVDTKLYSGRNEILRSQAGVCLQVRRASARHAEPLACWRLCIVPRGVCALCLWPCILHRVWAQPALLSNRLPP